MKTINLEPRTFEGYLNDFKEPYRTQLVNDIQKSLNAYNESVPEELQLIFEELMERTPPERYSLSPRMAMLPVIKPELSDETSWLRDEENNLDDYLTDEAKQTIGFFVEQIEDKKLRERVVDLATKEGSLSMRFAVPPVRNAATAITMAFEFSETEEGQDYWVDVVNNMLEQQS